MRIKKPKLITLSGLLITLFLVTISVQFACFYRILRRSWDGGQASRRADVTAVFRGAEGRVEKGFELANNGVAPLLVISPSSKSNLATLDRRYRRNQELNYLLEPRADTTFQNALFVSRLMAAHQAHGVVLVTSDYHMPRAYLLLWMERLGTGTTILPCPVESRRFANNPLAWSTRQKKQVYNEMVQFWGSIFEMGMFYIHGQVPVQSLKKSAVVSFLRKILLFEV